VATLTLTIQCDDDLDVSDGVYQLFGPYEDAKNFGEWVTQHQFTLARTEGEAATARRSPGRPRKAITASEE
jgi:cytochrome c1